MKTAAPAPLSALASLFVGVALLVGGQGLVNTTVSLALEAADAPGPVVGTVLAAYFLGWIAACMQVPRLLRRVGHIRAFAALGAGACTATLLYTLLPASLTWLAVRLASGFCMAGVLLTVESWLTLHAPAERRGLVLALYLVVFQLGVGGGQGLLLLTGVGTYVPYVLAALLIAVGTVPVSATRSVAPAVPDAAYMPARVVLARAHTALLGALVSGLLIGAYQTLGPIFLRDIGFSAREVGLWMAAATLGGLLLQWPIGHLSDAIDRRVVLAGTALAATAAGAGLAWLDAGFGGLLLMGVAFGSLAALLYPLALAHGNDRVAARESLALGATLVLVAGVGSLLGPLAGTVCMAIAGPRGLFLLCAGATGVLALVCLGRLLVRDAPTAAQSEPYVATPRTTIAATLLDPRVPDEPAEARSE